MPDIVAGVIGIALVFIWIYCLYDVITTHDALVRNLPKIAWFVIVLLLPDLGSILWLCFGRPRLPAQRVSFDQLRPRPESVGEREFEMSSLDHLHPVVREREELARLRMMQAQLERRENELRQRGFGDSSETWRDA
ncbi:MAG TPA: PLD nuclease N-terminal domain-containing protein [Acidimicrobiales bacterium]|nr:PLD nuclease N-terminal domain-containing protein [Acidimicrobiales bacterium]